MKGNALVASLLMVSLIGTVPGIASAGDRDAWRDRREQRGDWRDWRGDHDRHDRYGHYRGHERIRVGRHDYYHRGGRFFRPGPFGLISIQAPIGAIVATLPIGFSVRLSGGHTYFQVGGAFYSRVPAGYMVVDEPVYAPPAPPPPAVATWPDRVTVQPALLNIRSGPGMNFAITGQVARGQQLPVHGNSGGWYYVEQPDGGYGWVMVDLTLP